MKGLGLGRGYLGVSRRLRPPLLSGAGGRSRFWPRGRRRPLRLARRRQLAPLLLARLVLVLRGGRAGGRAGAGAVSASKDRPGLAVEHRGALKPYKTLISMHVLVVPSQLHSAGVCRAARRRIQDTFKAQGSSLRVVKA